LWHVGARLGLCVADIKWRLGIATQVPVMKVNVIFAKIYNNDTDCECYNVLVNISDQGHFLVINIASSTQ